MFIERHELTVKAVTYIGHNLPKDWENKMAVFWLFVKNTINEFDIL